MLSRESVFFAVVLITMSAVADSARAQDPDLDQLYANSTAYRAGFLPLDRADVDAFHLTLPTGPTMNLEPSVAALKSLLANNPYKAAVNAMLAEQDQLPVPIPPDSKITSIDDLLTKLNHVITRAPSYCWEIPKDPCISGCSTSTIHFPMSALFVYVMFTPTGRDFVFEPGAINEHLQLILQAWCRYLDSAASLNVVTTAETGNMGWLSPGAYVEFKLWDFGRADGSAYDFSDPHWGFTSYNDFFHRELITRYETDQRPPLACQGITWDQNALPLVGKVPRPIANPQNPRVIVSANDGTVWRIERNNLELDPPNIKLKSQPYSLVDIFNGNRPRAKRYVNGSSMQSFLSGANYHRFHAPVDGVVRVVQIVNGLMFSELGVEGFDPFAGTKSQGYETNVNTRGLIIIDTPDFGSVVVMPVGITEISSITITVSPNQSVTKGQELGYFSYGGSTLLLLFEPGMIPDDNWILEVDDPVDVNQAIAHFGEPTSVPTMTTGPMVVLVGLLLVGVVVIARRRRFLPASD